jgi:hypothetical protein
MSWSWFRNLFGFDELKGSADAWAQTRSKFHYDAITGTLTSPKGETFLAGKFSTPTLNELREEGRRVLLSASSVSTSSSTNPSSVNPSCTDKLKSVHIFHEVTEDVLLSHSQAPLGSVILAASGLNCLEFPSHDGSPIMGITNYEYDNTQGPACAIACVPGSIVRNYFSENTPTYQIDCLSKLSSSIANEYKMRPPWIVHAGYIKGCEKDGTAATLALDEANRCILGSGQPSRDDLRSRVCVGVQEDTCVTFSSRWERQVKTQVITQVYASALSLGGYKIPRSIPDKSWEPLATLVLEAAYEATLWAGVLAAGRAGVKRGNVYLCGLGLGVFENQRQWVTSAIVRAIKTLSAEGAELDVHFLHFREIKKDLQKEINEAL